MKVETWKRTKWNAAHTTATAMFGGGVECAVVTVGIMWYDVLVDILVELRGIHETFTDNGVKAVVEKG